MLLLLRMPVVAVVGAEARRPVALVLLLKLLLLKLLLLAVLEAPVPADGVGGGAAAGGAALRGVTADVHGAGVRVAAAAGDARHPGAATDHPGGDVLLVAVLHVHDELPGAVAATAVPRQERLPPRRRLGLLVEVFGLLQLILPRLQKK